MTMLLGLAGSFLVGFIMRNLLHMNTAGHMIPTIIGATIGALILIFLFRRFWTDTSSVN